MVLQTPCFEGALNPSGFQGEKLGCLEGAGSGFGCLEQVVVGVRRGRAAGQVRGSQGQSEGADPSSDVLRVCSTLCYCCTFPRMVVNL